MHSELSNPVFSSLCGKDRHLGSGTETARFFEEEVSPFAGFETGNIKGFEELYELLPANRKIMYATTGNLQKPEGWNVLVEIKGLQFVLEKAPGRSPAKHALQPLTGNHVKQMVELASLTKPGPFASRTIEFGYYFGIFENDQLVAMTGQRLHVNDYTEISAVCTHPDHLGKGYAHSLMLHQVELILQNKEIPFLHVREDNSRAIEIYERIGFRVSRGMNFYLLMKE